MATVINTSLSAGGTAVRASEALISELPPVLTMFIESLNPTMHIVIFCAVWLGIVIPILVILFFTSTKSLRRSGIFISNAIAICIGIVMGILSIAFQTNAVLNPIKGLSRPDVLAYTYLSSSAGIYIDCILLFRVVVVYPRVTTATRVWYGIMTPLVLFKIACFVNLVVFMVSFGIKTKSATTPSQYTPIARSLIEETIEWSLQLADNALCSSLFLWRLNQAQSFLGRTVASLRNSSYYKAISALFWIATTNFVFPCVFDIIMFILFYRDSNSSHYLIVLISNVYVQIIGVLFATIWRATHEGGMGTVEGSSLPRTRELTRLEFARNATETGVSTFMTTNDRDVSSRKEYQTNGHV